MINIESLRTLAVRYAWQFIGTPYEWSGDNAQGADCSGFVGMVLRAAGLMRNREDLNSKGLHERFMEGSTTETRPGNLVFYGELDRGGISHVGIFIEDGIILEAAGGNSKTKTKADADRDNAFVRMRPYTYRKDLLAIVDPFKASKKH